MADDETVDVDLADLPEDETPKAAVLSELEGEQTYCAECDKTFSPRGYKIHRTRIHGDGPVSSAGKSRKTGRGQVDLEPQLMQMFGTIALGVSFWNEQDGQILLIHSENMAKAWANLAKQNPRVYRVLSSMTQTAGWGEVTFATLPVIIGIMANHGAVNPLLANLVGSPISDYPPDNGTSHQE